MQTVLSTKDILAKIEEISRNVIIAHGREIFLNPGINSSLDFNTPIRNFFKDNNININDFINSLDEDQDLDIKTLLD